MGQQTPAPTPTRLWEAECKLCGWYDEDERYWALWDRINFHHEEYPEHTVMIFADGEKQGEYTAESGHSWKPPKGDDDE